MRLTKEQLIAAAHAAAKYLPADSADIMKELANRLDVTSVALRESLEQRKALLAENSVLLRLITDISQNHIEYLSEGEDCMMAGVPLDYVSEINMYVSRDVNAKHPFPATDAILDSLRTEAKASGLDEMAATYRNWANEDDCSCNMKSSYNLTAERAESYAAYIRRPAKNKEATSNGR